LIASRSAMVGILGLKGCSFVAVAVCPRVVTVRRRAAVMIGTLLDASVASLYAMCADEGEREALDAILSPLDDDGLLNLVTASTIDYLRGHILAPESLKLSWN
jgi:hypothetical protein